MEKINTRGLNLSKKEVRFLSQYPAGYCDGPNGSKINIFVGDRRKRERYEAANPHLFPGSSETDSLYGEPFDVSVEQPEFVEGEVMPDDPVSSSSPLPTYPRGVYYNVHQLPASSRPAIPGNIITGKFKED